jgi:hypothetical protein
MAKASTLGIPEADYLTLRDFYHFNYSTQTQILLAMGKSDFSHVDFEQENIAGIPVEVRLSSKEGNSIESSLDTVSTSPLDNNLLQLPNVKN